MTDNTQPSSLAATDEVQFLQQAIRTNTVSYKGDEAALAKLLAQRLADNGFDCRIYDLGDKRANLIATLSSPRPGPRIVFTGHMDTVPAGSQPWLHDPFAAVIDGDKLYGRGAVDMKGGLVASMFALLRFAQQPRDSWAGELVLAATSTEETGAQGAQIMVEQKQLQPFDGLIVAEPTNNELVIAHKGALWTQIEGQGKSAHSSMPDQGVNALEHLFAFYQLLGQLDLSAPKHPLLDAPTLVLTMLNGGTQNNVVPDYGRMVFDIRSVPNQDHRALQAQIQALVEQVHKKHPQASLSIQTLLDIPAVATDANAPLVKIAQQALAIVGQQSELPQPKGVRFFTDASVLQQLGKEIIVLGPGAPTQAHQTDEHIYLQDYLQAIELYGQILQQRMVS